MKIIVYEIKKREEILHNHLNFDEPKITFDEILDKNYCWHLNILDFDLIEKSQKVCKDVWKDVTLRILDIRKSGHILRITSSRSEKMSTEIDEIYTGEIGERSSCSKLNQTDETRR